ncbi:A1S_2505 family phage non-structural protein [Alloprevotella tannerae]|uniref:A1S_2505 family phage non-structural protein n=1 Tax=Alloprevotella tannerae TaxID=76122 RepID=UPI0035CF2348
MKKIEQVKLEQDSRVSPDMIRNLNAQEIFVFGSNLQGMHGGGAARVAVSKFGAIMGQGVGIQGQSYAIPTMQGGVETIQPYVDEFIEFAKAHSEYKFLVTRIGCGIAGFTDSEVAPLFKEALTVENIYLPESFLNELNK